MDEANHEQPWLRMAESRLWLFVLFALISWQGCLTLTLFGGQNPIQTLLDSRPIVSGSHPLHLYFGWLGASSLRSTGNLYCYDPAFQAGYPKTPVFDSGSRPAELFLTLAGGSFSPAAYKVGLAVCCLLVPILLAVTARGVGLSWVATVITVAVGLLVWWGDPCRNALEAGDIDLLIGGLCAAAFIGQLLAFDRAPSLVCWLGMLLAGALGWFAHPFLFLLLFPLLLIYYLGVGPRHRLGWHLAWFGVLAAAPGLNLFWLVGWMQSWWLRLPVQFENISLTHRTWRTFWDAGCWGDPADRALTACVFIAAAAGVCILNESRQRTTARVLGLGAGGLGLLTLAGMAWPAIGRFGTMQLLLPALWFAIPAAVFALGQATHLVARWTGGMGRGVLIVAAGIATLLIAGYPLIAPRADRLARTTPFEIGLDPERQAVVDRLLSDTSSAARILWEERGGSRNASRWTALLPLLTGRALMGGLGPDICIEHAYAGLVGQKLAGRSLSEWSDADLEHFCRRYNIGWVACWTPATIARFKAWNGALATCELSDGEHGVLFNLQPRSFVLKGKAHWLHADSRHITLADVVPEDGVVVVSLHYQTGLQVSPPRVQLEREPDPNDPIPLVRLRVPAPVSHVTLTWQPP